MTFTNSGGQTVFSFAAPTLTDNSASAHNGPVTTTLTPTGAGTYTLTVTPSQTWLQASTTHYPVVLDPTVNFTGATQDTFLLQNYPTTPYGGTSYINAGYNNGGADHALLQFDVSAIPAQAQVLDAQLGLYNYANLNSNATSLALYAVTQPWAMDTATWDTTNGATAWTTPGGTIGSTAYATTNNLGTSTGWDYWDPTQLVQGWVDGALPNDGMLLQEPTNSVDNLVHFTSTSSTTSSEWPVLTVNYALRLGQQPYYTMPSQTLPNGITLGTNVYNGNLDLGLPTVALKSVGLNENLTMYYNSLATSAYDLGTGWFGPGDTGLWVFSDGSVAYGSPSSFWVPFIKQADGSFLAPSGLNATLVQNSDGTYTLTFHKTGIQINYTSGGEPISEVDRNGNTMTYAYNAAEQITSITDTNGGVTTFTYNSSGYITTITDPAGRTYQFGYTGNNLTSYTNSAGNETQFAYNATNNLTQITDPDGNVTMIAYNSTGQVTGITRVTNPTTGAGNTTTFTYNSGNTVVTAPDGGQTTYTYDPNAQVTQLTDPNGHVTQVSYNADSQVTQEVAPSGATTAYSYNSNNVLTQLALPTGANNSYQYTDASWPYSVTAVTNAEGGTTTYSYDTHGNLTSVLDANGKTTSYTYNSNGTLASVTDPNGNTTSYQYDSNGNLTKIVYPAPLGPVSYTYDTLGRVTSMTDGKGQTTTYSYNARDQVTQITYADGTSVTYTYDADGNLTAQTDSSGTTTYTYNALGQQTGKTLPNGQTISYTYDGDGNMLTKTDSGGTVTYGYNAADQLTSVTDPSGAQTTFAYDANGNQTQVAYPNGVTENATYNGAGQVTQIQATNSAGTVLTSFGYNYTNPTTSTATNQIYSVTNAAGDTTAYQYDPLNRLAQATQTNASGTVLNSYSWTYDANGNMLSKTANGTITNLSYNAANEMTQNGSYTYTYDANGNLTGSSAGLSLSYNAANQTTSITPAGGSADPMTYAGVGQANRLTEGTNTYQSDLTGISAMTTSAGTDYFTRTPSGQLLSDRTPSGTYYYLLDAQGSVVGLTNSAGTLVDSYTYEPYGGIQSQTQNVAQPFKWIGAVYDSATGLYYIGHRYYDPNFDRWTQMDPSGLTSVNLADPQTADLYIYALDNPTTLVDVTGLRWSWSHFGRWTGETAAAGGVAGMVAEGVGAPLGFGAGAVIGAAAYTLFGWW